MIGSAFLSVAHSPLIDRPRRAGLALIDQLDRCLASIWLWRLSIIAIFALQLGLIATHRPWLDEAQALLLALQSPTIADLLHNLRYEAHPPLWYLLLRAIGALLDPRWVLPVAVAIPALVAQYCILLRAPFTRGERLLLSSSEFVLFEFFTISRSASLGVCILILAVACWQRRGVWLAIALLPLCDFLFGVISLVLIAVRGAERRLWWPGLTIWAACSAVAAWTVRPAHDIVQAIELKGPFLESANFFLRLGGLLLPLQTDGYLPRWDGEPPLALGLVFGAGFLAFAWHQTRDSQLRRALLFGFIAFALGFNSLIYPLPLRHLMLIALILIAFGWLSAAAGKPLSGGMRLWLLGGSVCGLLVASINFVVPFDNGHLAAAEIERRGLADEPWMTFPDSRGLGVGIHLRNGMEFERTERHCRQSFVHWNYRTSLTTLAKLQSYLRAEAARTGRFYLLSFYPLEAAPGDIIQPIASIPAGYDGVEYHLYVVGPIGPKRPLARLRCVEPVRSVFAARIF